MLKITKGKLTQLLHLAWLVCLLALPCPASAAPSLIQRAAPAVSTPGVFNQNAPAQGTIAITSPQRGVVWYSGSYYPIQWTCNGTRSNLVDVSLWRDNQKIAAIATGSSTGRTAHIVPLGTSNGNYEVRVISATDPRIEARLPVTVVATSVAVATPQGSLQAGSPYRVTWSYSAPLQTVKLSLVDSAGAVVWSEANVPLGSNGQGSRSVTLPLLPAGYESGEYRIQVSAVLPTSVTSNVKKEFVLGMSGVFSIISFAGSGPLPQINKWFPTGKIGQGGIVEIYGKNFTPGQPFMAIGGVHLTLDYLSTNEMHFKVPDNLLVPDPGQPLIVYKKGGQIRTLEASYRIYPNLIITKVEPANFKQGDRVKISGRGLFLADLQMQYSTTPLTVNGKVNPLSLKKGDFIIINRQQQNVGQALRVMINNVVYSPGGDSLEFTVGTIFQNLQVSFCYNGTCGQGYANSPMTPPPPPYSGDFLVAYHGGYKSGPPVTWRP